MKIRFERNNADGFLAWRGVSAYPTYINIGGEGWFVHGHAQDQQVVQIAYVLESTFSGAPATYYLFTLRGCNIEKVELVKLAFEVGEEHVQKEVDSFEIDSDSSFFNFLYADDNDVSIVPLRTTKGFRELLQSQE